MSERLCRPYWKRKRLSEGFSGIVKAVDYHNSKLSFINVSFLVYCCLISLMSLKGREKGLTRVVIL